MKFLMHFLNHNHSDIYTCRNKIILICNRHNRQINILAIIMMDLISLKELKLYIINKIFLFILRL